MTRLTYLREIPLGIEDRTVGNVLRQQGTGSQADSVYLRWADRTYSYGSVHELSLTLARGLLDQGFEPGTHVAVLMDNSPEMLFVLFALAMAGLIALPVNTAFRGEQLASCLDRFGAGAIILDAEYRQRFEAVAGRCLAVRRVIVHGGDDSPIPQGEVATLTGLMRSGQTPAALPPVRHRDVVCITMTSGTSGPSKGILTTHAGQITGALGYAQAFGYDASDTIYVCLPLFHANAYLSCCLSALVSGASVAIVPRFSATAFWEDIRRFGATRFNALGAMMNILWSQEPRTDDGSNPVKSGFAVPIPAFGREFAERFDLVLTTCYALTDFGTGALLRPDRPAEKWASSGQVRPEMDLAILGPDDEELTRGSVGQICLRAREPWIGAQGYYGQPAESLARQSNLWFHTGDFGFLDDDGYLYFHGRSSDAIRRRAENISAFEIEQIVLRHPAVSDAAAYAVRSELGEDEVMVSVVAREGASLDQRDLIEFCAANLAYFMVPRYVETVTSLPRTATHKIEKHKLQRDANLRLAAIWDREKHGIDISRRSAR
jgi:carnitine-CoA ligase